MIFFFYQFLIKQNKNNLTCLYNNTVVSYTPLNCYKLIRMKFVYYNYLYAVFSGFYFNIITYAIQFRQSVFMHVVYHVEFIVYKHGIVCFYVYICKLYCNSLNIIINIPNYIYQNYNIGCNHAVCYF